MKLIRVYVRDFIANKVVNALIDLKAPLMAVMDAEALREEIGDKGLEILARLAGPHTRIVKIELICNDEIVERIKDTVITTLRTGHKEDGLIAFFQLRNMKA